MQVASFVGVLPVLLSVVAIPSVAAGGSQSHALARPSAVIWDAATDGKTAGSKTIGVEGKKRDKLTRSERADVTQWALQQGVPAEEMISAYEGIPQFTAMAAQIEAAKPNSFAASGIEWVGTDAKPWIVFTDRPDSQVLTQLQSLSTEVEVEWGAPASKQELETISAELLQNLSLQYKGNATTSIDTNDWSVTVTTDNNSVVQDAHLQSATKAAGEVAADPLQGPDGSPRPPISIIHTTADLDGTNVQATVQGGRNLNLISNNTASCTASFTAVRNGVQGVLTAAHCPNDLRYTDKLGVIKYVATAANSTNGMNDFQFHKTLSGNSTNAQFKASSTGDRTVKAVSNPSNGQIVCKWGRTSGYGCATVAQSGYCVTYSGIGTYCGLVAVGGNITAPGDSGGPWFFGNTATGGHTGTANIVPFANLVSVFTEISRVGKVSASVKVG
jgi:hypothetical protein